MADGSIPVQMLERTRGRAAVAIGCAGGRMRLEGLHQSGSAKAFLPRVHDPVPEVVFLNTSGGLTGGDRLSYSLTLGAGAAAVAATQTAERAYRSGAGHAELEIALELGAGAALDWLPQETILFERSALRRRTRVEMAADARLVLAECVVLGRAAMGEVLSDFTLSDWREVRRAGQPVLIEPLRLSAASLGQGAGAGAALLGDARALATVAMVAPDAEDALGPVRAVLAGEGISAAASAWEGKCVVRIMGHRALPVRQAMARVLKVMRGRPLPRVWQL